MDGPPAVSISMDPVTRDVMRRPPRPKNASILSQRLLARVGFSAAVILIGVLYILAREIKSASGHRDQTMVSLSRCCSLLMNANLTWLLDFYFLRFPRPCISSSKSRFECSITHRLSKSYASSYSLYFVYGTTIFNLSPSPASCLSN